MGDWTEQDMVDALSALNKKSVVDSEFRQLALSDPKAAVKQVCDKDVPGNINIRIVENEPGVDRTFVLPKFRGGELSDEELDKVAGGAEERGIVCWCDYHGDCTIDLW